MAYRLRDWSVYISDCDRTTAALNASFQNNNFVNHPDNYCGGKIQWHYGQWSALTLHVTHPGLGSSRNSIHGEWTVGDRFWYRQVPSQKHYTAVEHENGEFISNIFIRPKKDNTHRLILNLSVLNDNMEKLHLYQFTCFPNGLTSVPRVFTKLWKPVYSHLRKRGFCWHFLIFRFVLYQK